MCVCVRARARSFIPWLDVLGIEFTICFGLEGTILELSSLQPYYSELKLSTYTFQKQCVYYVFDHL